MAASIDSVEIHQPARALPTANRLLNHLNHSPNTLFTFHKRVRIGQHSTLRSEQSWIFRILSGHRFGFRFTSPFQHVTPGKSL